MGNVGVFWVPLLAISGWIIISCVKIVYGQPRGKRRGNFDSEAVQQRFGADLAERDATIAGLRERIEVLERIITDKSSQLGQDIERLRA